MVAQFNGTDADLNQNAEIGYRIVSGNGDGVFEINNHTGELFTVKELDAEIVTKYLVRFLASTGVINSSYRNCIECITAVNDRIKD